MVHIPVLVLISRRPVALEEKNEPADARLLSWHPEIEDGNAIAGALFGDYNLSGKLTMTFSRNWG